MTVTANEPAGRLAGDGVEPGSAPPLWSSEFLSDPYATYAALRRADPVHRVSTPQGYDLWLLTRYADVRAALADPRFSRDLHLAPPEAVALTGDPDSPVNRNLLTSDPPDHTRVRKLVQRAFTPRRVAVLAARVQELTDRLLDDMPTDRPIDLISDFSYPLPITMICELLGVPVTDRDDFRRWTDGLMPAGPGAVARLRESQRDLLAYFVELIRRKRAEPGDDLVSALIEARDGGSSLSEDELVGMAFMLLIAGHETTVNLITTGVAQLLCHPEQKRMLLADDSLWTATVDEVLRHDGPAGVAFMVTLEPVQLSGTTIPARQVVAGLWHAANRDPEQFPDPDRFDIRRGHTQHLGFGYGIHRCIGAPLATTEARIAVSTLLRRFPDVTLAVPPRMLRWKQAPFFRGLTQLPLVLGRPAAAG